MSDPVEIISAVCDEMRENGFSHSPRIVPREGFDLSRFSEQESEFPGVAQEWVDQMLGGNPYGDDFQGTLAVPLGDGRLFVIEYST